MEDSQVCGVSVVCTAYSVVGWLVEWMALVVDFLLRVLVRVAVD